MVDLRRAFADFDNKAKTGSTDVAAQDLVNKLQQHDYHVSLPDINKNINKSLYPDQLYAKKLKAEISWAAAKSAFRKAPAHSESVSSRIHYINQGSPAGDCDFFKKQAQICEGELEKLRGRLKLSEEKNQKNQQDLDNILGKLRKSLGDTKDCNDSDPVKKINCMIDLMKVGMNDNSRLRKHNFNLRKELRECNQSKQACLSKIRSLEREIADLENEILRLKKLLALSDTGKTAIINKKKQEIADLARRMADVEKELSDLSSDNDDLKKENLRLKKGLAISDTGKTAIINKKKQEIADLAKRMADVEKELSDSSSDNTELENEILRLKKLLALSDTGKTAIINKKKQEIADLAKRMADVEKELSDSSSDNTELENEILRLKKLLALSDTGKTAIINKKKQEIADLARRMADVEKELSDSSSDNTELENEILRLKKLLALSDTGKTAIINKKKQEIADLARRMADVEKELSDLSSDNDDLKKENLRLKKGLAISDTGKTAIINKKKQEIADLAKRMADVEKELSDSSSDNTELENEILRLKKLLALSDTGKTAIINKKKQEIADLAKRMADVEKELSDSSSDNTELENEILRLKKLLALSDTGKTAIINKKKQEIADLARRMADVEKELSDSSSDNTELENEILRLKKLLALSDTGKTAIINKKKQEIADLARRMADVEKELSDLSSDNDDLKKENLRLKKGLAISDTGKTAIINKKKQEIADLAKRMADVEKELSDSSSDNTELENEILRLKKLLALSDTGKTAIINKKKQEIADLAKRMADVEKELSDSSSDNTELENEILRLKKLLELSDTGKTAIINKKKQEIADLARRMADVEKELSDSSSDNTELENEILRLKKLLALSDTGKTAIINKKKQEIADLARRMADVEKELSDSSSDNTELENEILRLKKLLALSDTGKTAIINKKKQEIADLARRMADVEKELSDSSSDNTELENEILRLKKLLALSDTGKTAIINKKKQEIADLAKRMADVEKELSDLSSDNDDLKKENLRLKKGLAISDTGKTAIINKKKQEIADLAKRMADVEKELSDSSSDNTELENEILRLKKLLALSDTGKTAIINKKKQEIADLAKRMADVEKELSDSSSDNTELENEILRLKKLLALSDTGKTAIINKKKQEIADLARRMADVEKELSDSSSDNTELENEILRLKKLLALSDTGKTAIINKKKQEIADLARRMADVEKELSDSSSDNTELENEILRLKKLLALSDTGKTAIINKKKQEIADLARRMAAVEKELSDSSSDNTELENEILRLKKLLALSDTGKTAIINKKKQEIADLAKRMADVEKELSQKTQELVAEKARYAALETKHTELQKNNTLLQSQNQELQSQNDNLSQQLEDLRFNMTDKGKTMLKQNVVSKIQSGVLRKKREEIQELKNKFAKLNEKNAAEKEEKEEEMYKKIAEIEADIRKALRLQINNVPDDFEIKEKEYHVPDEHNNRKSEGSIGALIEKMKLLSDNVKKHNDKQQTELRHQAIATYNKVIALKKQAKKALGGDNTPPNAPRRLSPIQQEDTINRPEQEYTINRPEPEERKEEDEYEYEDDFDSSFDVSGASIKGILEETKKELSTLKMRDPDMEQVLKVLTNKNNALQTEMEQNEIYKNMPNDEKKKFNFESIANLSPFKLAKGFIENIGKTLLFRKSEVETLKSKLTTLDAKIAGLDSIMSRSIKKINDDSASYHDKFLNEFIKTNDQLINLRKQFEEKFKMTKFEDYKKSIEEKLTEINKVHSDIVNSVVTQLKNNNVLQTNLDTVQSKLMASNKLPAPTLNTETEKKLKKKLEKKITDGIKQTKIKISKTDLNKLVNTYIEDNKEDISNFLNTEYIRLSNNVDGVTPVEYHIVPKLAIEEKNTIYDKIDKIKSHVEKLQKYNLNAYETYVNNYKENVEKLNSFVNDPFKNYRITDAVIIDYIHKKKDDDMLKLEKELFDENMSRYLVVLIRAHEFLIKLQQDIGKGSVKRLDNVLIDWNDIMKTTTYSKFLKILIPDLNDVMDDPQNFKSNTLYNFSKFLISILYVILPQQDNTNFEKLYKDAEIILKTKDDPVKLSFGMGFLVNEDNKPISNPTKRDIIKAIFSPTNKLLYKKTMIEIIEDLIGAVVIFIKVRTPKSEQDDYKNDDIIINDTFIGQGNHDEKYYYQYQKECFFKVLPYAIDFSKGIRPLSEETDKNLLDEIKGSLSLISKGKNVILAGSGPSGSGKTYTLNVILRDFFNTINGTIVMCAFEQHGKLSMNDAKLNTMFTKDVMKYDDEQFLLYNLNELNNYINYDKNTHPKYSDDRKEDFEKYKKHLDDEHTGFINDKIYNRVTSEEVNDINSDVIKDKLTEKGIEITDGIHYEKIMRMLNFYRVLNGRIKPTINNPESSRGHLFLVFRVKYRDGTIGYLIILDMGGQENPKEILMDMFRQTTIKETENLYYAFATGILNAKIDGKIINHKDYGKVNLTDNISALNKAVEDSRENEKNMEKLFSNQQKPFEEENKIMLKEKERLKATRNELKKLLVYGLLTPRLIILNRFMDLTMTKNKIKRGLHLMNSAMSMSHNNLKNRDDIAENIYQNLSNVRGVIDNRLNIYKDEFESVWSKKRKRKRKIKIKKLVGGFNSYTIDAIHHPYTEKKDKLTYEKIKKQLAQDIVDTFLEGFYINNTLRTLVNFLRGKQNMPNKNFENLPNGYTYEFLSEKYTSLGSHSLNCDDYGCEDKTKTTEIMNAFWNLTEKKPKFIKILCIKGKKAGENEDLYKIRQSNNDVIFLESLQSVSPCKPTGKEIITINDYKQHIEQKEDPPSFVSPMAAVPVRGGEKSSLGGIVGAAGFGLAQGFIGITGGSQKIQCISIVVVVLLIMYLLYVLWEEYQLYLLYSQPLQIAYEPPDKSNYTVVVSQ